MGGDIVQTLKPLFALILLVVATVINAILGVLVYRSNRDSATNRSFALLSLFTICWLVAAYIVHRPEFSLAVVFLARLGIFFAAPTSAMFFLFAHTFPYEKVQLSRRVLAVVVGATVAMMALNLSPYAFLNAEIVNESVSPKVGLGLIPFTVLSTLFSVLAIYYLVRKLRKAKGDERRQFRLVLLGISLMLFFVTATILVPIVVFNSGFFVVFAPLYALIFLGMTAYAIVRHQLFRVRVVGAAALVIVMWVVLFARIFIDRSLSERVVDAFILVVLIAFGLLLIRSVLKEVEQRERLEVLTKELEAANDKLKELDQLKSEFISLASHQLRSPLAVIRGYLSMILEGSYGAINADTRKSLEGVLASAEQLIRLVTDLLNLSRIESGKLTYNFGPVVFADVIEKVAELLRESAKARGVVIRYEQALPAPVRTQADFEKLYEVVANLMDNAIKYSSAGEVLVRLEQVERGGAPHLRFSVHDDGIGIAAEDLPRLFSKFIRTDAAKRVRAEGMGIGLYFAKRIIEDHGGRIWAESPGLGKGSTFIVELPIHRS